MELLTSKHLSTYRDGGEAIYIAIQGEIFDVTESRHLYGKGGPYEILAGREIGRALAMFDLKQAGSSKTGDLDHDQLLHLKEWIGKFRDKYKKVGEIVDAQGILTWKRVLPIAALAAGCVAVALVFSRKK